MKGYLQRIYSDVKRDYVSRMGWSEVPEQYRSTLVCVGGASEQTALLADVLQRYGAHRVLVVGVYGGRDYWFLKVNGYAVDGFDLQQPDGFPPIHVGNVEDAATIPAGPYDAVVLCEVLEHLVDDAAALRNLRAVLKADGILYISVPFFHDVAEVHIRIHSPITIRKLLAATGYETREVYYRPWPFVGPLHFLFNTCLHAISAATYVAGFGSSYRRLLPPLWRMYRALARFEWPHRHFELFGAAVVAVKSNAVDDFTSRNKRAFFGSH